MLIPEEIRHVLELIATGIDAIGIVLVLIGAAKFVVFAARIEIDRVRGLACAKLIRRNRAQLGGYILAALEFMIVSDIIHSVLSRALEDLILLGVLVVIRTAIGFFLGLEIKELEIEEAGAGKSP